MRSSYSNQNGTCIDVGVDPDDNTRLYIRETDPELTPILVSVVTSRVNFQKFIAGVKNGEFDHFGEDSTETPSQEYSLASDSMVG